MTLKNIALCLSALLVQSISGQCIGNPYLAEAGYMNGLNWANSAGNLALAEDSIALTGGYGALPCGGYGALNGLALGGFNSAAAVGGGGPFGVTSASPNAPNGMSAIADRLAYEGPLNVAGNMPFLGTVGFDGAMPAGGMAVVSYGAGDGTFGITSERAGSVANAAAASALTSGGMDYGYGLGGLGYGAGLGASGLAAAELGYDAGLNRFAGAGLGRGCGNVGFASGGIAPGGCACGF